MVAHHWTVATTLALCWIEDKHAFILHSVAPTDDAAVVELVALAVDEELGNLWVGHHVPFTQAPPHGATE